MSDEERIGEQAGTAVDPLGRVAVRLLRGVLFRDRDPGLWEELIGLRARVSDHMAVLGLELVIDEGEGYAYLHSRGDEGDGNRTVPRLIPRRPLSFRVSLLLALLRKKLVEQDATGGGTRLVMSRDEIAELVRVFLPEHSNEARVMERLDADLRAGTRGAAFPESVRGCPVADGVRQPAGGVPGGAGENAALKLVPSPLVRQDNVAAAPKGVATGRAQPEPKHRFGRWRRPATGLRGRFFGAVCELAAR